MKRILISIIVLLVLLGCISCGSKNKEDGDVSGNTGDYSWHYADENEDTNYAIIETSAGNILVELYPDKAPITVDNFKSLIKSKFYDEIIFHRVVKKFVIQAGDPTGTGYSGSGKTIKGEFSANGVNNSLKHERGVLSMARNSISMDSASSQFFICLSDSASVKNLDGSYAAFGRVLSGMDVVDSIASVNVDYNNKPVKEQTILKIRLVIIDK